MSEHSDAAFRQDDLYSSGYEVDRTIDYLNVQTMRSRIGLTNTPAFTTAMLEKPSSLDAIRTANLQILAIVANAWVPAVELLERDTKLRIDRRATIAALDRVVLQAILDFAGLRRTWCCRSRGRNGSRSFCRRCCRRWTLDTVRVADSQILTVVTNAWIPTVELLKGNAEL
jgi:hypothetical protein